MTATENLPVPTREQLIHQLYEAAELEHCLMCTYLYAAFSLKSGTEEGLSTREAEAVASWRQVILQVAIEEMGHLTAVWNITAALGGSPRFGRGNFPLDPGTLPAGMVVKLAPFCEAVLQHFIHLERPGSSAEQDGVGFVPERSFTRGIREQRLTPMPLDYDTVGVFYASLDESLHAFSNALGEKVAFCGDPALQLSAAEVELHGAKPVLCLKTARAAFLAIVEQGEGAPKHSTLSHFNKFSAIRDELRQLRAENPHFEPAWPAAENPVLRRPMRDGRIWIESADAAETVDLANTGYALMLRLLGYSYLIPRPQQQKSLVVDLALGLMRAITPLAERAARLPVGPSHPGVNAGMSFTALRDAAPLPPGPSAERFFVERLRELSRAASALASQGERRTQSAARLLEALARQAESGFPAPSSVSSVPPAATTGAITIPAPAPASATIPAAPLPTPPLAPPPAGAPPVPRVVDGVDHIEGKHLTLLYEGKKCIHSRFCVTWGPQSFLANVPGPWIHPDAMRVEALVEIAHACPSG
ncbi:MAG TPA: ferritin-like domain-containing protein, partial [Polyangiaceae bacterium]|nr:ferritin-like domain-containing protein [Polyangiaceae bacterium]